jgi:SAM-dependent methyltransferase
MCENRISENDLIEIFICPCCLNAPLKKITEAALHCADTSCYGYEHPFTIIDKQPILIDFRSSFFKKENYNNAQLGKVLSRRKGKFHAIIKKIIHGNGLKSKLKVDALIHHLAKTNRHANLLIVGGGAIGNGTQAVYNNATINTVSFDIYLSDNTNFVADAHQIPLKDASFDAVIVQAVLEHVISPAKVVDEIYRVLKPGGLVYAETPFMQQVHEKAYDFTRFTESGHRWLFKHFELIESGAVAGPAVALGWSIRYFFAGLFRSKRAGQFFSLLFFWLRFFDKLMPETFQSDGASCFFFLGKKSDAVISEKDIISFYRGVK